MSNSSKISKSVSIEETRAGRNWCELPNDIVLQISDNLSDEPFELRRFRAVCQSWRSLIKPPSRPILTPILPIPNFTEEDKKKGRLKTCRLFQSTLYTVRPLPRTASSSSKPWIIKLEEETLRGSYYQDLPNCFHFVDPLSQHLLVYPSFPGTLDLFQYQIREFCKKYVLVRSDADYVRGEKNMQIYVPGVFVTSFSHTTKHDDDFAVMGLTSTHEFAVFFYAIMVYTEACNAWHTIEAEDAPFSDIIYYKEKFMIVDCNGKISAFDPNTRNVTLVANPLENLLIHIEIEDYAGEDGEPDPLYEHYKDDIRLVESNEELFLIDIYSWTQNNHGNMSPVPFPFPVDNCRVFKLDEIQKQWTPVHNLGDRVFLVGLQCSYSLLASDFPEGKRNCIYFTEQWLFNPRGEFTHNIGVFDLENGTFEKIESDNYKKLFWPLPAWIQASDP